MRKNLRSSRKFATYQFTARFDGKTGKFRIISKKKVPSME